jgi:hypothetical protein
MGKVDVASVIIPSRILRLLLCDFSSANWILFGGRQAVQNEHVGSFNLIFKSSKLFTDDEWSKLFWFVLPIFTGSVVKFPVQSMVLCDFL